MTSLSERTNEHMNNIIVNNAENRPKGAHKHATPSADNNFPYEAKLTIEIVATEQKLDRKLSPLIKYLDDGIVPNNYKFVRKNITIKRYL